MKNFNFIFLTFLTSISLATELKPITSHPDYNHDKFKTLPRDLFMEFGAYVVSFDSNDDDNNDGKYEKKFI